MKKVLIKGPFLSSSGYGEHARFVLRALMTMPDEFDIYLHNTPWGATSWVSEESEERKVIDSLIQKTLTHFNNPSSNKEIDVSLQVTVPHEWEKIAKVNIGVTAGTETNKISPMWVKKSLLMDKIIVVSEHSKSGIVNTVYDGVNNDTGEKVQIGVTTPVEVVGFPVKKVNEEKIELELEHDFNFLVVATWIPRKNLENTIKWFVQEFKDKEVGLVLKTNTAKLSLRDREHTKRRLEQVLSQFEDRKCSIYLLHGEIPESQMVSLYKHPKIKCLLSLSHGEGFGLPLFEAACNGLPIITPAWGGPKDYLYVETKGKKTPMFTNVAHDLRPIQPEAVWDHVLIKDSQWCFPQEWSVRKGMKNVVKNYDSCLSKAKKLKEWTIKNFDEAIQCKKMCISVLGYEPEEEFESGLELSE